MLTDLKHISMYSQHNSLSHIVGILNFQLYSANTALEDT